MNKILLVGLFVLSIVLAACTPVVPVSENVTNVTNSTNATGEYSDVNQTVDEPVETEENNEYAATIRGVEGDLINLNTRAVDPDGDNVTLVFGEPFNDNGEWQTQVGDAGEYEVEVVASDGKETSELTLLVVVDALNLPPSIQGPDVIEVQEGETIDLAIYNITDPEGDEMVVSYSGWLSSSEYTTEYDDAGVHEVRIIAEDTAGNEVFKVVSITVENVNRKPRLMISNTELSGVAGDRININATTEDPDGDEVKVEYSQPFKQNGVWQSQVGDEGKYTVTVTANDGTDTITREVTVDLEPRNRAPVIIIENEVIVNEGDKVVLGDFLTISDPDGDEVVVNYNGWMTSSTKQTDYTDAGEYVVTVSASDEELQTVTEVSITVQNVNRPPVFTTPA
jgi:VCBS repeat-containing protein